MTYPNYLISVKVQYMYYTYVTCFLLWLTYRFARETKRAETSDPILGRRVSDIVFLQNQRLLTRTMQLKFQLDQ